LIARINAFHMRPTVALLAAVLLTSLSVPAVAQPSWQNQIAVTGGAQLATGDFGAAWKTGSGFAVTYYHRPSSHFFFGLRGGYHRFQAQAGPGPLNVIPAQFASKLNLTLTGLQPYLGVDGGLSLLRPEGESNSTKLGVAPKFGVRIPIASGVDLDLNATYELIIHQDAANTTYLGLNAGFAYIFGR
jgi:hypothetical protein